MSDVARVYLAADGWNIRSASPTQRTYCHRLDNAIQGYHLLLPGEVFVEHDGETYCLTCAAQLGIVTTTKPVLADSRTRTVAIIAEGETETLKLDDPA